MLHRDSGGGTTPLSSDLLGPMDSFDADGLGGNARHLRGDMAIGIANESGGVDEAAVEDWLDFSSDSSIYSSPDSLDADDAALQEQHRNQRLQRKLYEEQMRNMQKVDEEKAKSAQSAVPAAAAAATKVTAGPAHDPVEAARLRQENQLHRQRLQTRMMEAEAWDQVEKLGLRDSDNVLEVHRGAAILSYGTIKRTSRVWTWTYKVV